MSSPRTARLEYAHVSVESLDEAVDFYREIMGLVELSRSGETVYLGCGLDDHTNLAVSGGDTGLNRFGIRVNEREFKTYAQMLNENEIDYETLDDPVPGMEKVLSTPLPSGPWMDFAIPQSRSYLNPARPARSDRKHGLTPLDIDHINLAVDNCKPACDYLQQVTDFQLTEYLEPGEEGFWQLGFLIVPPRSVHHDIGFTATENADEATLHHVGWLLEDFDHVKRLLDRISDYGIRTEFGPSRHGTASNLFCYFWEPGGNRFELSSEMAIVETDTPVVRLTESNIEAWRDTMPPESFARGS